MSDSPNTADDFLTISPRIRVMPIIHGSGDFAIQVREELLSRPYDCVAVPLPPSFQEEVEAAVEQLPAISVVVQVDAETERRRYRARTGLQLRADRPLPGGDRRPCARRAASGSRVRSSTSKRRASSRSPAPFPILMHSSESNPSDSRRRSWRPFRPPCPARTPSASPGWRPGFASWKSRYRSILFVCSILDWPWIRDAYQRRLEPPRPESFFAPIATYAVDPRTLIFALGELPYITGLYERGRRELLPDDNLSVDGVKEMVLDARERLKKKHPKIAQRITPQLLSVYFRYIRNLSLIDRRLTPDLYTLVVAAQQTAGDDFALALAETARSYPFDSVGDIATHSSGFEEPGLRPDGDQSGRAARLGHRADGQPAAGTGALVADLRAEAPPAKGRPDPVAPALGSVWHVLVAARG